MRSHYVSLKSPFSTAPVDAAAQAELTKRLASLDAARPTPEQVAANTANAVLALRAKIAARRAR